MARYDHYAGHGSAYPQQPPPPAPSGYPGYPTVPYANASYPNTHDGAHAYPADHDPEAQQGAGGDVSVGTASTAVRLGFLRRVYALLTLCFGVTVGTACVFALVDPVRTFVLDNVWLFYMGLIVGLASYIALVCVRLKRPWNVLLLGAFVGGFSFMIGTIVAAYYAKGWGGTVLMAFGATAAIFLSITVYVLVTKKDFSYLGGFLLAGLMALIVVSLITFVTTLIRGRVSKWVHFAVAVLGALIFTGYILYDTSIIVNKFGPDDWIQAVVSLYIDVTQLFLYLLQIFSILQN